MLKRILALGTTLLLAAGLTVIAAAAPASASGYDSAQNQPGYWETLSGEDCYKIDKSMAPPFVLPAPPAGRAWSKVVIKAGAGDNANTVYTSGLTTGAGFAHASKDSISHVILCSVPAGPTTTPTASLSGSATCEADGTYTVTWTGTLSDYGTLRDIDIKVIKHAPAGSLINGVDGQVWLYEWAQHAANHGLPNFPTGGSFTYTQTGIPGNATSATSAYQFDWKDGPSGDPEVTISLDGDCSASTPEKFEVAIYLYPKLDATLPASWENSGLQTFIASKTGTEWFTEFPGDLPQSVCGSGWGVQQDKVKNWTYDGAFAWPTTIQFPHDNIGWPPIYDARHDDLSTLISVPPCADEPAASVATGQCTFQFAGIAANRVATFTFDNTASNIAVEFTVDGFPALTRTVAAGATTTAQLSSAASGRRQRRTRCGPQERPSGWSCRAAPTSRSRMPSNARR